MSQRLEIHPVTPQPRLLGRAAAVLRGGGVIVYPTDTCYAFGCRIGDKAALERIRRIRRLAPEHQFALVCRDLSELAAYARVDNSAFRLLKAYTPGPYTFLLTASREVPRRLQDPRRRTVGLRVPDHPVTRGLLESLGEPVLSSTVQLEGDNLPLTEGADIHERLGGQVDLVLDSGACSIEPSTVVDLTSGVPVVVRVGLGDPAPFGGGD